MYFYYYRRLINARALIIELLEEFFWHFEVRDKWYECVIKSQKW